jgi:hypothetical protein
MDFFAAPAPATQAPAPADAATLDPNNLLAAFGAPPPRAAQPAEEVVAALEVNADGGNDEEDEVAFI